MTSAVHVWAEFSVNPGAIDDVERVADNGRGRRGR